MLDTTLELHQGHQLRVACLGPPNASETVVLLHGYPDNLQIFSAIAPCLAITKQVIAFDWPGQGDSDDWPGGATPIVLAKRLLALLDAWELAKIHFVGQDMGGQLALVFAAAHSERMHSLVVMNCLVGGNAPTSWEIR